MWTVHFIVIDPQKLFSYHVHNFYIHKNATLIEIETSLENL